MSSVTLMHLAKAVGRNEMPFGRDTRMVPANIVSDRGPSPPTERGDLGSETQFAAMPLLSKLLWPLLSILILP